MRTARPFSASLVTAVFAVPLVAFAPAAAGLALPPTPVGGTSRIDCFSVCIVNQQGAECDSSANQGGTIDQVSTSVPFSVSGFRRGSAFGSNPCATATPVNLPANLSPGQVLFFDILFKPHVPGLHEGNLHIEGHSASNTLFGDVLLTGQATGGNATAPCVPGPTTLCLNNNRFKVQTTWAATNQGTSGQGNVVPFQTNDSGLFWFFDVNNWETVVKVLNACPVNDRFWVFAGGLTNVETVITVTDTQAGRVKTYRNPPNTAFQPIQDTSAFATCP